MKNKQKARRRCAWISAVLLCIVAILPVLFLPASAETATVNCRDFHSEAFDNSGNFATSMALTFGESAFYSGGAHFEIHADNANIRLYPSSNYHTGITGTFNGSLVITFCRYAGGAYDSGAGISGIVMEMTLSTGKKVTITNFSTLGDDSGFLIDGEYTDFVRGHVWMAAGTSWHTESCPESLMSSFPSAVTDGNAFHNIGLVSGDSYSLIYHYAELHGSLDSYNEAYNTGKNDGYNAGKADGEALHVDDYKNGFSAGQTDAMNSTSSLKDMFFSIFSAPADLINGILDFDLFGINLASLVKTLITLTVTALIVVFLIKLMKR